MNYETAIRTKANRAKAAAAIKATLEAAGATVTVEAAFYNADKEIRWRGVIGPYEVFGELCHGSKVGAFGAHWVTTTCHPATFPRCFGLRQGVSVNQFHYGKATAYYDTLQELCDALSACVEEIAEHWGDFSEAERAAMDAQAQAKKARMKAAFDAVAAREVAA